MPTKSGAHYLALPLEKKHYLALPLEKKKDDEALELAALLSVTDVNYENCYKDLLQDMTATCPFSNRNVTQELLRRADFDCAIMAMMLMRPDTAWDRDLVLHALLICNCFYLILRNDLRQDHEVALLATIETGVETLELPLSKWACSKLCSLHDGVQTRHHCQLCGCLHNILIDERPFSRTCTRLPKRVSSNKWILAINEWTRHLRGAITDAIDAAIGGMKMMIANRCTTARKKGITLRLRWSRVCIYAHRNSRNQRVRYSFL